MLRKIQNADVKNKRVLVRVDFNVELKDSDVREKFKLESCKETVEYLLENGAKVALLSHLGRPAAVKTLVDKPKGEAIQEFSLQQIADDAERILDKKIKFIDDYIGGKIAGELENLIDGEILLLENVRFYPGEESNDENFAKQLAQNFDIFVNDAFAVSHRNQASVTGVAKILPSYAGFRLQKEIDNLDKVKNNPEHPAVAIIGGAKIETKLPLIKKLEETYDYILVGGKIANEAIDQKLQFSKKVALPVDFLGNRFDIGPETVKKFQEIISSAKTIIWNGPMGKFEEKPYDTGNNEILQAVIASGAYVLMGGGESIQMLEENNIMDKISFVSTGGGAMLEYLSGNSMPGIEALK